MATSRPSVQVREKSSFVCVPCSCSDVSRRAQAAVPSSSETGTTSLQCKSFTILSSDSIRCTKSISLQRSAVSISNVGKSARPATRKPIEKPTPRSHLPQRTAAAATSSVRERASKTSSSMPRAATSSAKQATATRKPIEKLNPSRSQPPQRTAAATSSVKERALKTSSSMPRAAASSTKQATTTRNPIEKPSPYRPQPPQRTAAAATISVKERAVRTSSSVPPHRTAAAATSSVKDRTLKTASMPRAASSVAKQVSATPTLRAGRMTTKLPYVRTRKNPGSVVSERKAAPRTVQKQPVVRGVKAETEASVWVDKQELVSASYIEVRIHDVSDVTDDPIPEIFEPCSPLKQASQLTSNADGGNHDRDDKKDSVHEQHEPSSPPEKASQLTSHVEGNDRDPNDINVLKDEQELVRTSSMEGRAHGEPEVKNDPVHEQHEPSSPPEKASQLTSHVEGNDRDRNDINVLKDEQELFSTSSMEGRAQGEPEVKNDPVHEQHEPSSPPEKASQLTSHVEGNDRDRNDIDVPKDEQELFSTSSMEGRAHGEPEIKNDPVHERHEPSSPPEKASQLTSHVEGNDRDPNDIDVPKDEQELFSTSSMEGRAQGEPEVKNDPVHEQHEPSSPPEKASQLTSHVEGNDRDRNDIDVPKDEQELFSTSSMEGRAHGEPEIKNDPVHEQHEPSSPPEKASQLTSHVVGNDRDRNDIDVPKDEQELFSTSSMEGRAQGEPEIKNDPVHEQHEPSSPPEKASQLTSHVVGNDRDRNDINVLKDEQELFSTSSMEGRAHGEPEVKNDPVQEQHEPSYPPEKATQLTSHVEGNDRDRNDINVPKDEQEPYMEGRAHDEPEVTNDPVHEQHEPSSPPEKASQLTSHVEGNDRDWNDINVPKDEQELVSTSSMEGRAHGEPEVKNDSVHEQHEPSSPPEKASQLTSHVKGNDRGRDDIDVPKDELLQASKEKPVARIINKKQRKAEKEKADAEENHKSPLMLGSPTRDFFSSASGETVQAKREAQIGNEVIEKTRSKLLAKQKSKVKALVGAFETVISLQDPDVQTGQS